MKRRQKNVENANNRINEKKIVWRARVSVCVYRSIDTTNTMCYRLVLCFACHFMVPRIKSTQAGQRQNENGILLKTIKQSIQSDDNEVCVCSVKPMCGNRSVEFEWLQL